MSTTAITPAQLQGIHCRFGRRSVLRGVDLEVRGHEIVALLGANGAGKTTLFSILVGLLQPDRGTRRFRGEEVGEVGAGLRARLAWVAHAPQLYGLLTARENLELYAELWGTLGHRSRDPLVLLRRLGLGEVVDQAVGTFSRGMAQRVVLARALALEPDLMVLDEPFTALDRDGRDLLVTLLHAERDRGAGILLSSHDVDQVAKVADRVLLLEGGVIAGSVERGQDEHGAFRERIASLLGSHAHGPEHQESAAL
jgi:ABC-type multidrug transport system ATPase subunit